MIGTEDWKREVSTKEEVKEGKGGGAGGTLKKDTRKIFYRLILLIVMLNPIYF